MTINYIIDNLDFQCALHTDIFKKSGKGLFLILYIYALYIFFVFFYSFTVYKSEKNALTYLYAADMKGLFRSLTFDEYWITDLVLYAI